MDTILIIGASGFVGGKLARALRAEGLPVRCLARNPDGLTELVALGCEAVRGDLGDAASLKTAMQGARAVYASVHTLSPQPGSKAGKGFMEIEKEGFRNVIEACRACGVPRVLSVTSIGITAEARSAWLSGRWQIEQMLLDSGLNATIFHPGCIVGRGGRGFENMIRQAKSRIAWLPGGNRLRMRTIAADDLVYYMRGSLDEPRTFGQRFDVGNDEVPSTSELIDGIADVLGRPRPWKVPLPLAPLGWAGPPIERMAKLPRGAIRGFVESMNEPYHDDPMPIRAILPKTLLTYRQAVEKALDLPPAR